MDIKKLIRKNILDLKPYTSARDIYNNPSGILLDANENNLGSTFDEIDGLNLNRYPDPHQNDLRKLAELNFGIKKENLFFGVGSDEIIDLLIRIFCEPEKNNVIIPEPTYGMYKVSCDINNVETRSVLLTDEFQIDEKAIGKVCDEKTKIIFLCSPNNPTGNLLKKNDVLSLCENFNTIIIVDEAYIDFSEAESLANEISAHPNLIVLRTFSKAWGLAGARVGFCAANEEIINYLFKVKAPYNISALSRYALKKALDNVDKRQEYVSKIKKERTRLKNQFESSAGIIKVFDSDANFLLVKVRDAKDFQRKLFDEGIIVRDRSSQPKLEGCVRISIGTEEENDLLWSAVQN